VVVWPWMLGAEVLATVIVPAAPEGPKRPAIAPLNVLTVNARSSAIAKGPAKRLSVGDVTVVGKPSLLRHSYR
jgi:hypothetical protein